MGKVIGACGFIATGSSSVSDFLKEFEDNQVFDKFEFKIAYQTDGLQDLKYHLFEGCMKYESGLYAIQRFLKSAKGYPCRDYRDITNNQFVDFVNTFILNIIQGDWIGIGCDPVSEPYRHFVIRILKRLGIIRKHHELEIKSGKEIDIYPFKKVCFSIKPDNFDIEAQKMTSSIFRSMGWDGSKNIVLDQPFAGNNPQAAFDFYENPLAIVVDRDPRDYFIHCNIISYYKGLRQNPINDVKQFVELYRKMRESMPYLQDDNRIIRIRFEDMIYDYENTTKKIIEFCELKKHKYPQIYFQPYKSVNNTQLFKRYTEFDEQIKYIEKELQEYLYDFDKYSYEDIAFGEPFSENPSNPVGRKWKAN